MRLGSCDLLDGDAQLVHMDVVGIVVGGELRLELIGARFEVAGGEPPPSGPDIFQRGYVGRAGDGSAVGVDVARYARYAVFLMALPYEHVGVIGCSLRAT